MRITPVELDFFTPLLLMGARFALIIGVMLFIVSLGRDSWNDFSGPTRL